jgi:hypothetical protein
MRVADKSLVNSLEGPVVWDYDSIASLILWFNRKSLMEFYANQTNVQEHNTVVLAQVEIAESFILSGHQYYKTHIKVLVVFIHNDNRLKLPKDD